VILFSAGAWAQSGQNTAVGPDNGFFRPTPGNDPSLTNPRIPVPENPQPFLGVQAPVMVQIPSQVEVPVPVPVAAPQPPAAVVEQQVQKADVQTSQAESEAVVAARRAAAETR
jgi:hypothetical protein